MCPSFVRERANFSTPLHVVVLGVGEVDEARELLVDIFTDGDESAVDRRLVLVAVDDGHRWLSTTQVDLEQLAEQIRTLNLQKIIEAQRY